MCIRIRTLILSLKPKPDLVSLDPDALVLQRCDVHTDPDLGHDPLLAVTPSPKAGRKKSRADGEGTCPKPA